MFGSITYGMIPAAGSASDPLELVTARTLLEVMGAYDDIELLTSRSVLEVIGDSPYIPPDIRPGVTRAVLEVIGSLAASSTKQALLTRAVLEVLASAEAEVQELVAPSLTAGIGPQFSAFLAFQGAVTLRDAAGWGLTVRTSGPSTTIRLKTATGEAVASVPALSGGHVLTVQAGSTPSATVIRLDGAPVALSGSSGSFGAWSLDRLSGPDGTVGELVLFGSVVDASLRTEVEDYLRVKWA